VDVVKKKVGREKKEKKKRKNLLNKNIVVF